MKPITHDRALDFMRAGKATMTIQSKVTQKHFTFTFKRPKYNEEDTVELIKSKDIPIWVSVLTNHDNANGSMFIGTIFGNRFYHGKKSRINKDAQSVRSFEYWFNALVLDRSDKLDLIELYHEGKCMKCGRKLTTPDSIEEGIGPVCSDWIERQKIARDRKIRHQFEIVGVDFNSMSEVSKVQLMGFVLGADDLWY